MSIVVEQLVKRYEGLPVVNKVSLEVTDGELFVLLGPSGSGKSTVLRMIAGLASIDSGRVLLHGQDVTGLPTQQRNIGFVFQNYALFRHMTVGENVEFPLQIRKAAKQERRRRRDELLELVGLAGLGSRLPHQLSGGQQQRVALARALAHQPAVLLLDEPFGALDAKIRTELRRTMKQVQRETGTTTIFVTHDQEEAFELADRLGVMNGGRLLEVGPGEELYRRPQTEFVATFLGTANLLVGESGSDGVRVGPVRFPLATAIAAQEVARRVQVLFRPEDVALSDRPERLGAPALGEAEIEQTQFVGAYERLRLRMPPLPGVRSVAPEVPFGQSDVLIDATRSQVEAQLFPLKPGQRTWVGVRRMHALTHPGLRFLIAGDGSASSQAALDLGGQLAKLAHARTVLLRYGGERETLEAQLQTAKEQFGAGAAAIETLAAPEGAIPAIAREAERQPFDLVVMGLPAENRVETVEQQLQTGDHHLLLIPRSQPVPTALLICVTAGEPGKEDVFFAGRLARHLGAEATLMSVIGPGQDRPDVRGAIERFLQAAARTLTTLGVSAQTLVRTGPVAEEILGEMATGKHDMLVLGAPLPQRERRPQLVGVVREVVTTSETYPVLIVRSRYLTAASNSGSFIRRPIVKEVLE